MCFCLLRTTSCGDRVCPSRSLRFCACKAWIEEAEDRAEVNALIIVRAPVVLKRVLGDFHSCSSLASARHVKACASSCHETSHKVQVPTIPGGLYIYIAWDPKTSDMCGRPCLVFPPTQSERWDALLIKWFSCTPGCMFPSSGRSLPGRSPYFNTHPCTPPKS